MHILSLINTKKLSLTINDRSMSLYMDRKKRILSLLINKNISPLKAITENQ